MWSQLAKIIRSDRDKAVIIEDGEPKYVVLTIGEYNRILGEQEQKKEENYEKLNEELSDIEIDESAREEAKRISDLQDFP